MGAEKCGSTTVNYFFFIPDLYVNTGASDILLHTSATQLLTDFARIWFGKSEIKESAIL
jgi:hypothetical protein